MPMTRRGGHVALALSLTIVVVCAGLISWRLLSLRKEQAGPQPVVETEATLPPPKVRLSSPIVSTIIDLPGDPVIVQRGTLTPPRELRVALPAKVDAKPSKVESEAFFISSPLVSTDGGYMGKFPESGQDADALADLLKTNAAEMAGDPSAVGAEMDDDGGAATPENAEQLMPTDSNSNRLEIAGGAAPQLKRSVLRAVAPEKISDLLISEGYSRGQRPRSGGGGQGDLQCAKPVARQPRARVRRAGTVRRLPGRATGDLRGQGICRLGRA